jgi:hypothetical protein
MKAKYIGLMGLLLAAAGAKAQTAASAKTAYVDEGYNSYDHVSRVNGKLLEEVRTSYEGKICKAGFVDNKLTTLFIDGKKIPETDWVAHSNAIAAIRGVVRRNAEQAKRNAAQEVRNQEQAKRNAEQAGRNEEQAKRNAEQEVRNREQVTRNEEQKVRDKEQAVRNEEQVARNREQAKRDAEQLERNEAQAKRNEEQEARNREQAKSNAERAEENEHFVKELTTDLVNDKIIPESGSLREFHIDDSEMTVNGVKQPDAVFKKYREKYNRNSSGGFTYSKDGLLKNN